MSDANEAEEVDLHPMTKVEIVVNGADVAAVQAILQHVGVTGFTALGNVSGFGHGGYHEGRLAFNDRDGLCMLVTVAQPDRARRLVARLRPFLANRPGVMFVSETKVSRPDYFTA